jgi:hypothetical protein
MSPALRPPSQSPLATPAISQNPASSAAGLSPAAVHGGTKLGHAPYGVRPSKQQLATHRGRSESRVWLIVALLLLLASAAALVFVLAR